MVLLGIYLQIMGTFELKQLNLVTVAYDLCHFIFNLNHYEHS